MPFKKFGFPSSLLRNIRTLGYVTPTPIQSQAIPAVRTGRDLIATAQTGTGKTAAFLLPTLQMLLEQRRGSVGALVLTPTRELAQQIDDVFRGLAAGTPLRSALVIGGAPQGPQERALRQGSDLVVATPGRFLALLREGHGNLSGLRTLILDEADQMFDMGFFPDLKRIISFLPARRQTLLFSATMPADVARLGQTILRDPVKVAIGPQGAAAREVSHTAYPVPSHRKAALLRHLLRRMEMPSVLVFTRTRRGAKRLARTLHEAGHGVEELHSDRSPGQRARAMEGFRSGAFPVLVATNIAARGIDVPHISHVINFDVPAAPEEYVHRIGRTGRAGESGDALVLVSPEEQGLLTRIERQLGYALPRRLAEGFDYSASPPPKVGQRRHPQPALPRQQSRLSRRRRP
jgi:ATP-dependent RNA helicase RhlE